MASTDSHDAAVNPIKPQLIDATGWRALFWGHLPLRSRNFPSYFQPKDTDVITRDRTNAGPF